MAYDTPMIFQVIEDIGSRKTNLYERNMEAKSAYSAFLVNRAFSLNPETILHANEMNIHYEIPNDSHHDYMFNAVPKKNRSKSKWPKFLKNDEVELVSNLLGVNNRVAVSYRKALKPSEMKFLRDYKKMLDSLK